MATEDRTTEDVAEGAEASPPETNGSGKAPTGVDALKARVAAKRGGAAGKQAMIQGSVTEAVGSASTGTEPSASVVPSDAGTPDDEITPAAKDELARLASIREDGADASPPESESEAETSDGSGDPEQAVMEGLQAEGGSLYEKRQAEIAAAKARPGGRSGAHTASGRTAGKGIKAKVKETAKAKKEKEKAKAREKTEKQKEREADRKAKAKEKKDAKAKAEKERKDKLAQQKAERAKERQAKRIPDPMKKMSKAAQEAFAVDYAAAGPRTDRNPGGIGLRRAKADRGDFAAGYIMCLRRIQKQAKETGDSKLASAAMA